MLCRASTWVCARNKTNNIDRDEHKHKRQGVGECAKFLQSLADVISNVLNQTLNTRRADDALGTMLSTCFLNLKTDNQKNLTAIKEMKM